jgi:hypothetical protein
MTNEPELEYSPLTQTITEHDRSIDVYIYREKGGSEWYLEVVDDHDHSSVWEDSFVTDKQAWNMVQNIIKQEGFAIFLGPGPDDDVDAPDQMHAG